MERINVKIILILRFFIWDLPISIIMKWIEIRKWYKEQAQFEKEIKKEIKRK